MKTIFKLLGLVVIIGAASGLAFFLLADSPSSKIPIGGIEFQIKEGVSASAVGLTLKQAGLIHSELFFKILTRITGLDRRLKAGYLKIMPGERTTAIVTKILKADFITITFTIPEGYSLKEINQLLVAKGIATPEEIDDFVNDAGYPEKIGLPGYNSAEGFLFPETYTFHKGTSVNSIYTAMVKLFYRELSTAVPDYASLSPTEIYQKVTMASIIEKEVKNREEAPIVAGIFYNRLQQKMKLQSCATVQYILDKPKERLLDSDLLIENPYNTYLNEGLPPGPIANPGLNSLKAVFHPTASDFLFFVVKDPVKGTHQFSRTYAEHLRAQERYKEIKGFY